MMDICVAGLWHLGSVTAACLADAGHTVVGYDDDRSTVSALCRGGLPVFEPGLEDLVRRTTDTGRLSFTNDPRVALGQADVLWIAYDTPVNDADEADADYVLERARGLLPWVGAETLVVLSSQLPVGTTASLERHCAVAHREKSLSFACLPENLRLGSAIHVFRHPDRVVAGVRSAMDAETVREILEPLSAPIEFMSVESAEMTKHALNAFLAMSIAFANEVATVCELTGAEAREVERGLKTEHRVGPGAYLSPGSAFSGGTLARDVGYLRDLGNAGHVPSQLIASIIASNDEHRHWARRKVEQHVRGGDGGATGLAGRTIAVWGLAYKSGTDTLRRSDSASLCLELTRRNVRVRAHDPVIAALPPYMDGVLLARTPLEAARDADALVVASAHDEYRGTESEKLLEALRHPLVLDANGVLADMLGQDDRFEYITVGSARGR